MLLWIHTIVNHLCQHYNWSSSWDRFDLCSWSTLVCKPHCHTIMDFLLDISHTNVNQVATSLWTFSWGRLPGSSGQLLMTFCISLWSVGLEDDHPPSCIRIVFRSLSCPVAYLVLDYVYAYPFLCMRDALYNNQLSIYLILAYADLVPLAVPVCNGVITHSCESSMYVLNHQHNIYSSLCNPSYGSSSWCDLCCGSSWCDPSCGSSFLIASTLTRSWWTTFTFMILLFCRCYDRCLCAALYPILFSTASHANIVIGLLVCDLWSLS